MRRFWTILSAALLVVGLADACRQIKDNLDDCPQELVFKFYRQTGCDTQKYYPADFKDVKVLVYDSDDKLVGILEDEDITLTEKYELKATFRSGGDYTFVCWAAEDFSDYVLSGATVGESVKGDLRLRFDHPDGIAEKRPSTLYWSAISEPLSRDSIMAGEGSLTDTVWFHVHEYTYRINLQVLGLDETHGHTIYLIDDNDRYDAAGTILPAPEFNYTTPDKGEDGGAMIALFTELKLEEGRNATVAIWDDTDDSLVFTANLVEDLILYKNFGIQSPYNLDCDHDFNIIIVLRIDPTTGTYMAVSAWINDWNLVFRDVEGIQ